MKIFQMDRLLCRIRPEGKIPSEQAVSVRTMQLAWPVILESCLAAFVSMMDTVLVSVLGASAIAAAALTIQPLSLIHILRTHGRQPHKIQDSTAKCRPDPPSVISAG